MIAAIAICSLPASVSADSIFDTSKEIRSGVTQETVLRVRGETADYKINVKSSGVLTIQYDIQMNCSELWVYNSDGEEMAIEDIAIKSGKAMFTTGVGAKSVCGEWNDTTERFNATVKYKVSKGTYYIKLHRGYKNYGGGDGSGKVSLKATFPTTTASNAKISYLSLEMSKGSSIKLGAVLSGGTGKVTWSSSKKSVATVSSTGKVTAKSKGSTIISAKCNGQVVKIKVTVK